MKSLAAFLFNLPIHTLNNFDESGSNGSVQESHAKVCWKTNRFWTLVNVVVKIWIVNRGLCRCSQQCSVSVGREPLVFRIVFDCCVCGHMINGQIHFWKTEVVCSTKLFYKELLQVFFFFSALIAEWVSQPLPVRTTCEVETAFSLKTRLPSYIFCFCNTVFLELYRSVWCSVLHAILHAF